MTEEFEVIVGIYEGYVIGYRVQIDRNEDKLPNVKISRSFAGAFHTRSVRSLATHGKLLASGGGDDRVRIYDLQKRAEAKELFNHAGNVNSVVFVEDGKFLISGADDGKVVFTNTRTWEVEKEWKNAHKGAVKCIAVHPEGAMALTVGADMVLKTWNLVTGRNVYSTSLKNKPQYGGIVDLVRWSPDGAHFAVSGARCVEVYSIETGNVVRSHKVEHRTTDLCWIGEADLLLGMENGEMLFFNVETEEKNVIPAHEDVRLKAMFYASGLLVTISSSGELCLWSISEDYDEIVQLRAYSLDFRPICICIVESSKLGLTFEEEELEGESKENVEADLDESFGAKLTREDRVIVEQEVKEESSSSSSSEEEVEQFKGQKRRKLLENRVEEKEPEVEKSKRAKRRVQQRRKKAQEKAMTFVETEN